MPALPEVQELYSAGAVTIVDRVGAPAGSGFSPDQRHRTLRVLTNGPFTPKWASSDSSPAATLPSGLTIASRSWADAGALAAATARAG
jgi:hypothetical protein